jgi:tetratricopeptide (TPR) repeat protein
VAIDRTAILRNAEKLLRQGKLEPAILEYLRIVQDQPRDWNTANALGDLYVRASQTDKAIEQFARIADSLSEEGFLPKAGALYKKILKLKPDHEHALIQGAEIAASQGLLADARSYLNTVAERRRAKGDKRGAAQMVIRLGSLDPADVTARMAAASARVEVGDTAGAVTDLKAIAAELTEQGRQADAFEALRQAALLVPDDTEIRERLLDLYLAAGDFEHARQCASTVEQFKTLSAALEAKGLPDEALQALRDAALLAPEDSALKAHLARAFVARGDLTTAAEYLTVETAGNDPHLLLTVAEIGLRAGRLDEGLAIVRRLLEEDSSRRAAIAALGSNIAEQIPEAGFTIVELAADNALAQSDWAAAAAVLQEFVARVSNHIPALMRLVEVCVDGGLDATMYIAQAQLADAYIAAGSGPEARFIAEDLVARAPWEPSNIERFRRALVLLGEPDPDGLIADRLSGQEPFMTTDLGLDSGEFPSMDQDFPEPSTPAPAAAPTSAAAPATAPPGVAAPAAPLNQSSDEVSPEPKVEPAPRPAAVSPPARDGKRPKREDPSHFELSADAIDMDNILSDFESPPAKTSAHATSESVEVDLSIVLNDIKRPAAGPSGPQAAQPPQAPPAEAGDLDGVFERLRGEASRRSSEAEDQYKRGLALRAAGQFDESIQALQAASRAPRLRFQTGSLIGRMYRERGMLTQAIEWFEVAAQAPAPTADEGHLLLYELADMLESIDETARALAICLELQADAGNYRDIAARVDRLAKVQTRG